jgi:hypothetical protein
MSPEPARASWRARLPIVVVVLACVTGVTAAVTGAANPLSAVNFLMPGHWVFNGDLKMAFHVDGATGDVDARASVPEGGAGAQVYQGDTSGYVVDDERITEFGKSSLEVEGTSAAPSGEVPVGLEVEGGPYLVYREAGKVVRLGKDARSIDVGGPVGDPVATSDGTVWLPRTSAGFLCELSPGASGTACRVLLPEGNQGAMTVVDDRPMFVDTTADMLHAVEPDRLGDGRELGIDVPDTARVASTDVAGRVAMLDGNTMHLVDSGVDPASAPAAPDTVDLPDGDYDGPVSTGSAVALVDRSTDTLITYDSRGQRKASKAIPPEDGDPRLTLGEDDRIYVDGAEGEHVLVVDEDGSVTDVPLVGEDENAPSPDREPELGSEGPAAPPANDSPPVVAGPPPLPDREPQNPPQQEEPDEPEEPVVQQDPPAPPVVPASPPGAPTAVSAVAGDASATVNWGAAPDNRAPITGYTVSWPGGSLPVGPVGTANITGLANGTSYVFTVTATNAAGTGPGASSGPVTPVAPVPNPSVVLARGGDTSSDACPAPNCSWLHVTMTDFAPNTTYTITGVASEWGDDFSEPAVMTTDANGAVTFEDTRFDGAGQEVRVRVDGPGGPWESNTIFWEPREVPVGDPTVVLSRGPATEEHCGELEGCAWMHVVLSGFPPNSQVYVDPDSTQENYSNEGHTFTTDANGYAEGNQFAYAGVGETVHVNAHPDGDGEENGPPGIRSNDLRWEAG